MISEQISSNNDKILEYLQEYKAFLDDPETPMRAAKTLAEVFSLEDIISFIKAESLSNPTFSVAASIDFVYKVQGILRDVYIVGKTRRDYYEEAKVSNSHDVNYNKTRIRDTVKYTEGKMPVQGVSSG